MQNLRNVNGRSMGRLLALMLLLFVCTLTFGQTNASGVVKDAKGEPLIGVSVAEMGTTNGTITNVDGHYSMNVKSGAKLKFSYVGFTSQIVSASKDAVIILKEDNKTLNEVVVVGYGTMRRKDVTSSITTVNAKDLNVGVYTSPAEMLQGKVPGLVVTQSDNPNSSPSITLRGASTFRTGAAMEPYYIIDGVPGVSLSLISPDDIESIDVLRDATATAIYGSKAANGVIIVTTKKGKAGHSRISYSGYVAMDNVAKNYDVMNASQLKSFAAAGGITLPNDLGYDTNWKDQVQRTGFGENHNLSISGGTDKTTYNASMNYFDKKGVIRGTEMNRLMGRAFIQSTALKDHLTLSFNINTSVTSNHNVPMDTQGMSVLDAMYYYSPLVPVKNNDGSWYENSGISQNYNPVALIKENIYDTESKQLQGTAKASLKLIKGLVYNLSLSYQNEQNTYSNYNSTNSLIANGMNGKAVRSTVTNKRKILETYLNYDKTFSDIHKLGAMFGYSWEQNDDNDGFQLTTYDYYNDFLTYHNMGMANKIDKNGLGNWNLSTLRMISFYGRLNYSYNSKYIFQATVRRDGSSAFGRNNRWATFPSVSLAWRLSDESFIKKLNLFDDLKFRTGYGVSGNSMGFDVFTATQLYGASSWYNHVTPSGTVEQIHVLTPISNANPDLKWEKTGMFNVGIDWSVLGGRLGGTIEYYDKRTKDLIASYAVSTARYQYGWLTANVGEISNKGIEFTVNAVPIQTKDFRWSTALNLSHNKNRVEKLSNATYSMKYMDEANVDAAGYSTSSTQRIMEGSPIGQFYLWKYAGLKDGVSSFYVYGEESLKEIYKTQIEAGADLSTLVTKQADGRYIDKSTGKYVSTTQPQETDRTKAGSAQPKLTLGWNNTLFYKKWSLNFFFQGVFGNKILNATKAFLSNVGNVTAGKNVLAGLSTEAAKDGNYHAPSDRYLESGSYLRLSSLTLGYDFGRINDYVKGLRLYMTCNNVFTITGYDGIDPEINLGGITPGIDNRNTYPRTRTFLLGVNINF